MSGMEQLRPGDLMFGPIGGFVPGVVPVGIGQLALASRKARLSWRRWWKIRHVGVIVQRCDYSREPGAARGKRQHPRMVQAMPRGAEEIALAAKHWTPEYVYVRPAYDDYRAPSRFGSELMTQDEEVAAAAKRYVGTPYNFLTYGALAASALGLTFTSGALRRKISTRRDMMCSQLADQCLADAGFHVFNDGRLPQDVVPSELYRRLLEMPGTKLLVPGVMHDEWMNAGTFSS